MASPVDKVLLTTGTKLFPAVQYELMSEGYSEEYRENDPVIVMKARTRWPGSYTFVANMLGTAGTDATRDSGMTRQIPVEMPDTDYEATDVAQGDAHTPFLGWWCTGAKLTGTHGELACQDQVTGALVPSLNPPDRLVSGTDYNATTGELLNPGYDGNNRPIQTGVGFAEYDLTFEPLLYEIRTDTEMDNLDAPLNACELGRYVIRREKFAGNNFTMQAGTLYWRDLLLANPRDADAQINAEAVRPFPNSNLTYTWLNVPGIPRSTIQSCIGKVNKAEVGAGAPDGKFDYRPDWQGITWAGSVIDGYLPGTLLFEGASDITPKKTACGQLLYDITYNFFYRPDGHNNLYRAKSDDGIQNPFKRVVRRATKDLPSSQWKDLLDEATFSDLFKL